MAVPDNKPGRTPYDYSIKSATISNDRMGEKLKVGPAIAELVLYEHIEKPFMTGVLTLLDTVDLYNRINFQGTDIFEMEFHYPNTEKKIVKKFIISSLDGSQKSNDTVDLMIFHLVEYDFFKSRSQSISKAYFDTPRKIIERALREGEIEKELVVGDMEPVQERFRYIAPYINPFAVCQEIKSVCTTESGFPYYLYSTANLDDKLVFRNLKELLQRSPTVDKKRPFTYSSLSVQRQETATNIDEGSRVIEGYRVVHNGDLLNLMTRGFLGSTLETVNVNEFNPRSLDFDVTTVLDQITQLYPEGQRESFYDDEFMGGLHNQQSRHITNISMSNIYSDGQAGIHEVSMWDNPLKIFTQEAIRALQAFSSIDVKLPGYQFFGEPDEERTVGANINLRFYNNDARNITTDNREENEVIDTKKTGQYMIYAARHTFTPSRYDVTATCVKFTDLEETG